MSEDYEIKEALQLRNQRFEAALAFATNKHEFVNNQGHISYRHPTFEEAIKKADELITKLEAPTR